MGKRCPFKNECFVMKARKEAASANLIVVNHHLLFADIDSRMDGGGYEDTAVLPPYNHIVFDEAHGIEAAATSFFSESIQRFKLNRLLYQMYRKRKNSEAGHLCTLAIMSSNEDKFLLAQEREEAVKLAMSALEICAKDLMQSELTKRLCPSTARDFGPFLVLVNKMADALGAFCDLIRLIMEGISEDDKDFPAYWESRIILRHLYDYVMLFKAFSVWEEKKDFVFWIQKRKLSSDAAKKLDDDEYVVFSMTPLNISSLMNAGVYEPMKSVILTSATLKSGRDFRYMFSRIGLNFTEKERVIDLPAFLDTK